MSERQRVFLFTSAECVVDHLLLRKLSSCVQLFVFHHTEGWRNEIFTCLTFYTLQVNCGNFFAKKQTSTLFNCLSFYFTPTECVVDYWKINWHCIYLFDFVFYTYRMGCWPVFVGEMNWHCIKPPDFLFNTHRECCWRCVESFDFSFCTQDDLSTISCSKSKIIWNSICFYIHRVCWW